MWPHLYIQGTPHDLSLLIVYKVIPFFCRLFFNCMFIVKFCMIILWVSVIESHYCVYCMIQLLTYWMFCQYFRIMFFDGQSFSNVIYLKLWPPYPWNLTSCKLNPLSGYLCYVLYLGFWMPITLQCGISDHPIWNLV